MSAMNPEEVLRSIVENINTVNLESLMTLYEQSACFASQPGQVVSGQEGIRRSLRGFMDMKSKLKSKIKRVLQADDLALVITEWSFSGMGPDGKPINMASRAADVLRKQSDGT
jgi:ketosteroid isomerase-like protein